MVVDLCCIFEHMAEVNLWGTLDTAVVEGAQKADTSTTYLEYDDDDDDDDNKCWAINTNTIYLDNALTAIILYIESWIFCIAAKDNIMF
mmetsp:Transcript_28904/g.32425  ORF Transcript_28904/g.32425 Transcript_28904/m.32425 type:complete len:89 (+) Transcript_28904:756-1022(+)